MGITVKSPPRSSSLVERRPNLSDKLKSRLGPRVTASPRRSASSSPEPSGKHPKKVASMAPSRFESLSVVRSNCDSISEDEKEEEIQIGEPTDVKHVLHKGERKKAENKRNKWEESWKWCGRKS
ncbi:hypothetical protein L6452_19509 [Arctium lappa]|uniref:Uncharacterized protein n=1 Tax=Arctium lappa TaxID=4217 RepID=A0ACB9BD67_ARCLA|nr:hypothetical protein L6452_19509 [Arctium lappa]